MFKSVLMLVLRHWFIITFCLKTVLKKSAKIWTISRPLRPITLLNVIVFGVTAVVFLLFAKIQKDLMLLLLIPELMLFKKL